MYAASRLFFIPAAAAMVAATEPMGFTIRATADVSEAATAAMVLS